MAKHRITQTNGNSANGIKGSRIRIWNNANQIVDGFVVPSQNAQEYCRRYPSGQYGQRFQKAIEEVNK
jgi:hypothetical protein